MKEELTGILVRWLGINASLALSGNVFTFGIEWYDGLFAIRFGPIFFSLTLD